MIYRIYLNDHLVDQCSDPDAHWEKVQALNELGQGRVKWEVFDPDKGEVIDYDYLS